ncbi:hypothetical protein A2130_02745 [Candidatus Woesebacteria bacterium GWC2_33_12]|nr:MAG: hypothetical protein A2130_02745 [Candidatus Woesebacteria bacterium GWC2_33_12]
MLQGGTSSSGTGDPVVNYYEISHGTPTVSLNSVASYFGAGSSTTLTGTATDTNSDYSISGVEWSGSNTVPGSWTDCTPTDGSFDSTSEAFSCEFGSMDEGSGRKVYVRTHDQNDLYMPSTLYGATSTFEMNTREETGSTTPETYQVKQEVLNTTTTETVLTPTKDSNQGEQKVVVIIPPQTFNFNAFLSSQVSNIIYNGNYTKIGSIQEIWYKAYAPAGYTPVKITQDLQKKPSIVSLSYTGTYKNLKIAYSLDGKIWKILSNSVIDTKNKTVAAITKLGGYYTLVSVDSTTPKAVLGTTTDEPSPVPAQTPKISTEIVNQETTQKQTIINTIIDFFKNIIKSIGK